MFHFSADVGFSNAFFLLKSELREALVCFTQLCVDSKVNCLSQGGLHRLQVTPGGPRWF